MNISSKQIQWVLDKATPDIVLSKQSIVLDSDNLTDTFTITTNSTGNLSISSSDDSIAIVSLSGTTATVTTVANGAAIITVNVVENSNYIASTKTIPVDVQLVSTTLNDNSWDTIKEKAQSGEASSLWNVGDTKEVILNGDTVGYDSDTSKGTITKSFNNYFCYATILGFDHNVSLETNGEHSVHFILAKDSTGKDIMFWPFKMNDNTNWGWKDSNMKKTTMVEFKNCLSADIQAVLRNVIKYTHNYSGSRDHDIESYVTATTEQVFLLSEFEVFGVRERANKYEQDKQAQYAYYKNGNSKVRYRDDNSNAERWWLRSVECAGSRNDYFCFINNTGIVGIISPFYGFGIAPAFVV